MLDEQIVKAIGDAVKAKRERMPFTPRHITVAGDVRVEVLTMFGAVFVRAISTVGAVLSNRFIEELRAEGERHGSFAKSGEQQLASVREFSLMPRPQR